MPDVHRQSVAVVDDDDAVRDSLRCLLEAAGFSAVTFGSARDFLSRARLAEVACVLIDQHMPHTTGIELLTHMQANLPEMPVAMMTGSPSAELTRRAFELGAWEVLEKPLKEEVLLAFVARAIG